MEQNAGSTGRFHGRHRWGQPPKQRPGSSTPFRRGAIRVWVYPTSALPAPNKQRKKNRKPGNSAPSARPIFRPRGHRETSWGGDGTIVAPDSIRVSLPYEETIHPTATLGSLYLYQYRGNSTFDPNYTGVGGQPAGFDVWSLLYNEYTVISSHIELEIICSTTADVEFVVYPSYNTTTPATAADASVRPYASRILLSPTGNACKGKLRSSMSTAQMFGIRPQATLDDDQYGATISTNPGSSAVWYWNIAVQNVTSTLTLNDYIRVRLIYDVLFHDRISLSLSSYPRLSTRGESVPPPAPEASGPSTGASAASPCAQVLQSLHEICTRLGPVVAESSLRQ